MDCNLRTNIAGQPTLSELTEAANKTKHPFDRAVTVFDAQGKVRSDNVLVPNGFIAVDSRYDWCVFRLLDTGELVLMVER